MKDKEARYLYKCRNCGRVYAGCYSGKEHAWRELINAIYHIKVDNQLPVALTEVHVCSKTRGGIADLIGYRIK